MSSEAAYHIVAVILAFFGCLWFTFFLAWFFVGDLLNRRRP